MTYRYIKFSVDIILPKMVYFISNFKVMSNEAKLGDSVLNPNIFSNLQDGTKSKIAEANDSPREQVEPFGDTFQTSVD